MIVLALLAAVRVNLLNMNANVLIYTVKLRIFSGDLSVPIATRSVIRMSRKHMACSRHSR